MPSLTTRPWRLPIGGELLGAGDDGGTEVMNPADGSLVGIAPVATDADVSAAIASARAAQQSWWREPAPVRAEAIERFAFALLDLAEELATLDTACSGIPYTGALREVRSTVKRLTHIASDVEWLLGESAHSRAPGEFSFSQREPYGVAAVVTAYNHPVTFCLQAMTGVAVGNTVVVKAADQAPFSSLRIGELAQQFLPPGVFNVVSGGRPTGQALTASPDVDIVSLTGGLEAGQSVLRAGAVHSVRPTLLELGGKNPLVVLPDADVAAAARAAVDGLNLGRCMGQSCTSTSRALVHESVYEQFVEIAAGLVRELEFGDPMSPDCGLGPLISLAHRDTVIAHLDDATAHGADLVTGGEIPRSGPFAAGAYLRPAVLGRVTPEMAAARDEIFGPVLSVMAWDDLDAAIELANSVKFGLCASVFTSDLASARRLARDLQAGMVFVNSRVIPTRGISPTPYKGSGLGCFPLGGRADLERFTRTKVIHLLGEV